MVCKSNSSSRRKFIGDTAALGVMGAIGTRTLLSSCISERAKFTPPHFPDKAPDGPLLKAGLIGCGGRGTGAAFNFLNSGPNVQITALGDVFQHRIESCRDALKQRYNIDIPDQNCFLGFDAYKKVIESDVDVILEVSLAHFRPRHFEAAIQARKHVFFEKPAAADPIGVRSVMASGRMAESAGLTVIAGTHLRHQHDYVTTFSMVKNGAIGDLVSANCSWNAGDPPYIRRQEGWSDMEFMIRDRANWNWLTGDAIVNLLVHHLDVLNWFFEKYPAKATGFGGRHHRRSGDMYDFFSVDYTFDDRRNYQGMCRQIGGLATGSGQILFGNKGFTNCQNKIWDYDGNILWEYEYPLDSDGNPTNRVAISAFNQEMINLVTAIRTNNPVNQSENLASSTLIGIMGRESAYTGQLITWDDMMNSNLRLGPTEYRWGTVDIKEEPPIPGTVS